MPKPHRSDFKLLSKQVHVFVFLALLICVSPIHPIFVLDYDLCYSFSKYERVAFRPIKLVTFLKRMLNNSGSMSVLNVKTDPTGPVAT